MNKLHVHVLHESEKGAWDKFVDLSTHSAVFHYFDWLKCAEEESGFKFIPIVIEKPGGGRVCQFPVFIKSKWGVKVACSPPPGCAIPYLGPIFSFKTDNQHKIEADLKHSIYRCFDHINSYSIDYHRYVCTPEFTDIRPFTWSGFATDVKYTYRLDLKGRCTEEVYNSFDSKIRKMIRRYKNEYPESELREVSINKVIDQIKDRYSVKNRKHGISQSYFNNISNIFNGKLDPVGVFVGDNFINGTILLKHNHNVLSWVGSSAVASDYNGVNEFSRHAVINKVTNQDFISYESVGANTEALCENKSKYNFRPVSYFIVEKKNLKAKVAVSVVSKMQNNEQNN